MPQEHLPRAPRLRVTALGLTESSRHGWWPAPTGVVDIPAWGRSRHYSVRNAAIGSVFAACRAGR